MRGTNLETLPHVHASSALSARRVGCDRHRICLIAAGISVAIIAVVQGLGTALNTKFGAVQTALK